jgi:hypothetical protein
MTFQLARSVIDGLPYNYAEEVEKFRQAKLAHRFTGDVAPSAPAIIEQATATASSRPAIRRGSTGNIRDRSCYGFRDLQRRRITRQRDRRYE